MTKPTVIALGVLAFLIFRDRLFALTDKFSATVSNFRLGQLQLAQDRIGFSMNVTVRNDSNIPVNLQAVEVGIRDENSGLTIGSAQSVGVAIPANGTGTVPTTGFVQLSAASGAIFNLLTGAVPSLQDAKMPSALIRVRINDAWIGPFVYPLTLPEW